MKSALILVSVFVSAIINQSQGFIIPGIGRVPSPTDLLTKEQRCNLPRLRVPKRPYEVFLERVEWVTSNPDYFVSRSLKLTKYNRTTPVINATFEVIKQFPLETVTRVESYQLQGKRWDRSAVKLPSVNFCNFIETDLLFYKDLTCNGNLANKCPVEPGEAYFYNYHLDTNNFPYEIPGGEDWRYHFIVAFGDVIISELAVTLKTEFVDKNMG